MGNTNLAQINESRPPSRNAGVSIHAEGAPEDSPPFLQFHQVLGRVYRWCYRVILFARVVESMKSHHLHESHTSCGGHGSFGEVHAASLVCANESPCLGMGQGDKMLAIALLESQNTSRYTRV